MLARVKVHEGMSWVQELFQRAIDFNFLENPADETVSTNDSKAWVGQARIAISSLADVRSISSVRSDRSICAVSLDHATPWDAARALDAATLNTFETQENGVGEVVAYSVCLPRSGDIHGYLRDLNGFSSAMVEVRLDPLDSSVEAVLGFASDSDFIEPAFEANLDSVALAERIVECCGLEIPFRVLNLAGGLFTQGSSVGLLNALAAAVFAFAEEAPPKTVARILDSTNRDHWRLDVSGVGFEDLFASESQIQDARTLALGVSVRSLSGASEAIHLAQSMVGRA